MAPSRAFVARIVPPLCRPRRNLQPLQPLLSTSTKATATRTPRSYHSYDHPPPPGIFTAAEQAILSAAYTHVPDHGFTQHALSLGARDAGYPDISITLLPEGPFSLIRYHLVTQREALVPRSREIFSTASTQDRSEILPRSPSSPAEAGPWNISDKVERLTWERLSGNRDVNHRWQEVGPPSTIYHPMHITSPY